MGLKSIKNIQTRLEIPSNLTDSQKAELGEMIVDEIRSRTQRGIDRYGKQFKGYSEEYRDSLDFKNAGKSNKVNLTLTGDMLAELSVLDISDDYIMVGYENDDIGQQAEGNILREGKEREFIGLPDSVLALLIAEVGEVDNIEEEIDTRTNTVQDIFSTIGE